MRFLIAAMEESGHRVRKVANSIYEFEFADGRTQKMTIDRELAKDRPDLELIGLDHPLAHELLERYKRTPEEYIVVAVQAPTSHLGSYRSGLWKSRENQTNEKVTSSQSQSTRATSAHPFWKDP